MRLREYLKENMLTAVEFAEIINYNRNTLTELMNGRRKAGRKLVNAIILATRGKVKKDELLDSDKDVKN